jgi:hypothetical protein
MLVAALVWYRQFKSDLETVGFYFNPYYPCIANRKVNGYFFTKHLQGKQFTYFRNLILGKVSVSSTDIDDRSVLEVYL